MAKIIDPADRGDTMQFLGEPQQLARRFGMPVQIDHLRIRDFVRKLFGHVVQLWGNAHEYANGRDDSTEGGYGPGIRAVQRTTKTVQASDLPRRGWSGGRPAHWRPGGPRSAPNKIHARERYMGAVVYRRLGRDSL